MIRRAVVLGLAGMLLLSGCVAPSAVAPTISNAQPAETLALAATPVPLSTATSVPPTLIPESLESPSAPLAPRVGWWQDAVFYEVFVRSFYDSDADGIGDLGGLVEKLDYLNDGDPATTTDLGVTALWLMPIMQSPSYHGYDALDYYTVEQDYGVNADFQQLIEAAHQRGVRVIIDLVMNHTSNQHPWFIESKKTSSPRRDWYIWTTRRMEYLGPWGAQAWYSTSGGWYYGVFWEGMPDLNYYNPDVTAEMYNVARFWLEDMHADGFRLDAVRYLVEDDVLSEARHRLTSTPRNLAWLQNFRQHYTSLNPEAMTVGEVWTGSAEIARYLEEGALDLAFEFDTAEAIINSVAVGNPSAVRIAVAQAVKTYPQASFATFLTNHDQERVMTRLGGDVAKAKSAAATYLTLPGTPFLYYGEEIGMQGRKPDEQIRTPLQWSAEDGAGFSTHRAWEAPNADYTTVNIAAQTQEPDSLLSYYRRLIQLRLAHPALRTGEYLSLKSDPTSVYAYLRLNDAERLLVLHNYGSSESGPVVLTLDGSPIPAGTYHLRDELSGAALGDLTLGADGAFPALPVVVQMQPHQTLILSLR